jgi:hypothetical protein
MDSRYFVRLKFRPARPELQPKQNEWFADGDFFESLSNLCCLFLSENTLVFYEKIFLLQHVSLSTINNIKKY